MPSMATRFRRVSPDARAGFHFALTNRWRATEETRLRFLGASAVTLAGMTCARELLRRTCGESDT